jgi:alpha-glucosidase (family GH31 glycosyl hydrolase)
VDEQVDGPLNLTVYPGADGAASVYEDDGRSFDYRKGQFMRIAIQWQNAGRQVTLSLAPGSRMMPPASRAIQVVLAGEASGKTVTFTGKPLEVRL